MQLPYSPINPDNKLQTIALVFCFLSFLFWFGCKVYRLIRNYKREQEEKNKNLPIDQPSTTISAIVYIPDTTILKVFLSPGECIDYYKKNFVDDPDYDWFTFDLRAGFVSIGNRGEFYVGNRDNS